MTHSFIKAKSSSPIKFDLKYMSDRNLATLPENSKPYMLDKALKKKDNELAIRVAKTMKDPYLPLYKVISNVNLDVLKALSTEERFKKVLEFSCFFDYLEKQKASDHYPIMNPSEFREKVKAIAKHLIKHIDLKKTNITAENLGSYAHYLSEEEFSQICKEQNINLFDEKKYGSLTLENYNLPTTLLNPSPVKLNSSPISKILSHCYSNNMTPKTIGLALKNLYKMDPIAKEMIDFMASSIDKNNTLKIYFFPKAESSYNSIQNGIYIDSNTQYFLGTIIHEFGHWFYNHIFDFDALPYSPKQLFNNSVIKLGGSHHQSFEENLEKDVSLEKTFSAIQNGIFSEKEIHFIKDFIYASQQPLIKAAELLHMDASEIKDKFIDDQCNYMLYNSPLPVFYLNEKDSYNHLQTTNQTHQSQATFQIVLNNLYFQDKEACSMDNIEPTNACYKSDAYSIFVSATPQCPLDNSPTNMDIVKWAHTTYLPKIVKENSLTPNQVHFLERMADYILRGDLDYDENTSFDFNEREAELIVRYNELKAKTMDQDILDSFSDLVAYHHTHVSPIAQSIMTASSEDAICPCPMSFAAKLHYPLELLDM